MLVTVIIPAFNPGAYLNDSIDSALRQTHKDLEIIIVDDGCSDESIVKYVPSCDSRVHLIQQENAGKSVALNTALEMSAGDYYCILDADDRMHTERVARQAKALVDNPDLAAVFCGHELLMGDREVAPRRRAKDRAQCQRDIDAMRMPAHDPTGMYRLSMVREVMYEPGLRIGQGYDYILRVGEKWPMTVLEDCLYTYRVVEGSATRSGVERRQEAVRQVQARAAKRRGLSDHLVTAIPSSVTNRERDNGLSVHFLESVTDLRRLGQLGRALRVAMVCGKLHPLDMEYWKPMAACLLPHWLLARLGRQTHG